MMNSTAGDDDLPPNPFRSGSGANDLFSGLQQQPQHQPPPPQQQQTPQFAVPPQQQAQQFAVPPQQQQQQYGMQQQQQTMQQPDQFAIPPPPPQQLQPPQPQQQPQFSPGLMTNNVVTTTNGDSIGVTGERKSWFQTITDCFKMETYTAYFDVDTMDIQNRIQSALMTFWIPDHFRSTVVGTEKSSTHKGPDLYGPIWITFTLMFLIAVSSNFSAHMYYNGKQAKQDADISAHTNSTTGSSALVLLEPFEYDIEFLCRAGSILSFFVFVVPTILWSTTNICLSMSNAPKLVEWICLYGYSMVPYIPATLFCMLPWSFLNFVVLAAASGASCVLVMRNVSNSLIASDIQKAPAIIIFILVAHVVFFFTLKFSFYHHA